MWVAVYYNNNDIRLEQRPIPQISSDELLVKVIASGICGSDVLEWYRIKRAPVVLGHEIAGDIVKVGDRIKKYKVGDRVFVSHHVHCDECYYCLGGHETACETLHSTNYYPGGFAEYIRVPPLNVQKGVYLLDEGISYEQATFIEPLGCVVRAQRLAKIPNSHTVLIIGSGVAGLLHIQLAKISNVKRIIAIDINEYKLNKALEFGADISIDAHKEDIPAFTRKVNEGRLVDRVIICTSALAAVSLAYQVIDRGGVILFFAAAEKEVDIPFPLNAFWRNEITLMTSYGASSDDLKVALQLIKDRKINVYDMITHRFSLADISLAFRLVANANEKSIKVIIEPHR